MLIEEIVSTITENNKHITNIVDLDMLLDKSDRDVILMIGDLSIHKQDDTVLYCMYSKLSATRKRFFKIGFNIESLDDLVVLFYKGDVLYDRLDLISPVKIKEFIERASYEDTVVCGICNGSKYNLLSCTTCVGSFCNECAIQFKNKRCPFCNTDISNYFHCVDKNM